MAAARFSTDILRLFTDRSPGGKRGLLSLLGLHERDRYVIFSRQFVTAHPHCARKFTCHVMHRASALITKMNNDRADGHCQSFD